MAINTKPNILPSASASAKYWSDVIRRYADLVCDLNKAEQVVSQVHHYSTQLRDGRLAVGMFEKQTDLA